MELAYQQAVPRLVTPKVCTARIIIIIQTYQDRYKRRNLHRLLAEHQFGGSIENKDIKIIFSVTNED